MIIAFFSILFALKGGSGKVLFKNWNYVRDKGWLFDRILDGKVISTILAFIVMLAYTSDLQQSIFVALAWLIAVAPSMGEEHGAVGDYKEAWGDYMDYPDSFGREYGIKKCLQRGVWMGACMAVATFEVSFIWWSLAFVPCAFIGQSLNRLILKQRGWTIAEPIIGAVCFGVPMYLYV